MKYVFFGTPRFAAEILGRLIEKNLLPQTVVCNPDQPVGRKKIITPPPVKQLIISRKTPIEIIQLTDLHAIRDRLLAMNPDFFIVAAYAKILPREIITLPRLHTIGVHPSLLPKYRGPTPIQSAILSGEPKTGVTLFLMDEKVDHGPIIANRTVQIANRNYKELEKELSESAAQLLVETLPKFLASALTPLTQDENLATYTRKLTLADAYIDSRELARAQTQGGVIAVKIERSIRALNPEPGTWTKLDGKRLKILAAEIRAGKLKLKTTQYESKKPVNV